MGACRYMSICVEVYTIRVYAHTCIFTALMRAHATAKTAAAAAAEIVGALKNTPAGARKPGSGRDVVVVLAAAVTGSTVAATGAGAIVVRGHISPSALLCAACVAV